MSKAMWPGGGHKLAGREHGGGVGHQRQGETRRPSGLPALFWKKVLVRSVNRGLAGSMERQEMDRLGLLGSPLTLV